MKPPLISFFLLSRVIFRFIYLISKTWYRKMRFLLLFYRHFDAKNILNDAYFLGITSRWPLFMCKQSDYSLNSLQYYVRISFAKDYLYSIFMLQAVQVNSMPLILSCPIFQCFLVVGHRFVSFVVALQITDTHSHPAWIGTTLPSAALMSRT